MIVTTSTIPGPPVRQFEFALTEGEAMALLEYLSLSSMAGELLQGRDRSDAVTRLKWALKEVLK